MIDGGPRVILAGLKALLYHRPKARRWSRFRRHMFLLMVSSLEKRTNPPCSGDTQWNKHLLGSVLSCLCGTGRLDHFQDILVSGFCFTFNDSKYLHTANQAYLT